jgi:hypothetical protein
LLGGVAQDGIAFNWVWPRLTKFDQDAVSVSLFGLSASVQLLHHPVVRRMQAWHLASAACCGPPAGHRLAGTRIADVPLLLPLDYM